MRTVLLLLSLSAFSSLSFGSESTTARNLTLAYSIDPTVCGNSTVILRADKICRPYDFVDRSNPKMCSLEEVEYINIRGTPILAFTEIATNEYGYTRVFRTTAKDIEGYVIIYLEQFNGDNFPRTIETWKVNAETLNKVLELSPGPLRYEKGGQGKRKQKANHPKDTRSTEFAALLKNSEKLSDDWSPIVEIQGGYYLAERKCSGEWLYGGIYACNSVTQLNLKKISASKEATIYCQYTGTEGK